MGSAAGTEGPAGPIEAITFDYWNTLVYVGEDVAAQRARDLAESLSGEGMATEAPVVVGALDHVRERFDEHWRRNEQYVLANAVADLLTVLGHGNDPALTELLTQAWVGSGHAVAVRATEPHGRLASVLGALADRGLGIGIVCDVGLMPSEVLRAHLDRLGLIDYFDHWSFSDETGVYKPHATAFTHAFRGLGVDDARRVVHVGDLHRTDVAGARAVGARAVRYRGVADDPDAPAGDGGPVIDDLGAVLELLDTWD